TPHNCDDAIDCTTDSCIQAQGCMHAPDNTACDDQNPCTDDTCDPTCTAGSNDLECDHAHIGCRHTPNLLNSCSHNDACNGVETCDANGGCVPGVPVVCTASDQCHDVGVCDPASGQCSNPGKPDGSNCNDGNACTQTDTCQSGVCGGANPVVCTALDQCH